jgi:phospholipid/cholesterol/gamma-HCH transport system permease protein
VNVLLALPREWLAATGELTRFTANIVREVWTFRVLRFFGEALRQAGILIVGSTGVILALIFITGLGTCGIEGAYFTESQGAPAYAGVFTAWCNLREAVPYAFGYMCRRRSAPGSSPSSARCGSQRRSTRSR